MRKKAHTTSICTCTNFSSSTLHFINRNQKKNSSLHHTRKMLAFPSSFPINRDIKRVAQETQLGKAAGWKRKKKTKHLA
jgi:hypothetical protein